MIRYNPRINQNQYENVKQGLRRDIPNFAVNALLSPIALFALVILLLMLFPLVFGETSDYGLIPQILVGVGVPALVILSLINKQIGNAVFTIWFCLFYGGLIIAFLGTIIIWGFQGYIDLF